MKVTCIIVTYNPKQWIDKCLSALRTLDMEVGCIVVDNASTDGSLKEMQSKFAEYDFIFMEQNLGFGTANNIGIEKAYQEGADYFFLLNQDAYVEHNTVGALTEQAEKHPNYGILSPLHFNGNGSGLDYLFSTYIGAEKCKGFISDVVTGKLKSLYNINFVNAAAWLISKKCIERVGGFNPSFFHYGEDLNYAERVKYHEFEIGIVPTTKIYHDRQGRGESSFMETGETLKRNYIRDFSRPQNKDGKIYYMIKESLGLLGFILLLKKNKVVLQLHKLRALGSLNTRFLLTNRRKSLKKGLNFLNLKK